MQGNSSDWQIIYIGGFFQASLSTEINQRRSLCLQVLHEMEILAILAENSESGQIQQMGFHNLRRRVSTVYILS